VKPVKRARRALAERIEELAPKATPHELHQLAQAWRELVYGATGGRGYTTQDNTTRNLYEDQPPKDAGFR
jgi:hypothetical protein